MASHCNPTAFNLRIPSFIVEFVRVRRWVVHYASMQFRHLLYKQLRNQEGWGLQTPLAESLKNFNQKSKRLNLFWIGPESKRGWVILKFAIPKKQLNNKSCYCTFILQSTIVCNSFNCVKCIYHTLAILSASRNFWLMFANQLWADRSLWDMNGCKTLLLDSEKVADLRCGL